MNKNMLTALTKALDGVTLNLRSSYNARRVKECLIELNYTVSDERIAYNTYAFIQPIEFNENVQSLFQTLIRDKHFISKYLTGDLPKVNEYQVARYCASNNIDYPNSINWQELLYKLFLYHYVTRYKDETNAILEQQTTKPQKETTMNYTSPVTTKIIHTVNDKNVEKMTKDELISCIIQLEDSIAELNNIEVDSTTIDKEVRSQTTVLNKVVKYLDAKKDK